LDNVIVQAKGYTGRSDTIWTMLNNLRTPAVHDWLTRFSAFCQKSELAAEPLRLFCAEFNLTDEAGLRPQMLRSAS
jgi:hypothetical protein